MDAVNQGLFDAMGMRMVDAVNQGLFDAMGMRMVDQGLFDVTGQE